MASAAGEEGFGADVTGSSVTDLEIRVAVLAPESTPHRCFVYLRDALPYGEMPTDVASFYSDAQTLEPSGQERAARLKAIKQRLEAVLPDRVRHYQVAWDTQHARVTGLDAWGRVVLEDLWRELSKDATSDGPELSPAQGERNAVEDFAIERARDFVGRERLLNYLTRVMTSSGQGPASGVPRSGSA